MTPEIPARPRTIGALWLDAVAAGRERPAYLVEEGGAWRSVSWAEAGRRVRELANGLLALGVARGDAFALLGSTRLEWVLFDYALALVGAISVPIYATSSARDCVYALGHADAVGLLAEDAAQREKAGRARAELPRLEHVLTFADLDDLAERGRSFAADNPDVLAAAAGAIGEDDLYTYVYTSGATGPPKACMIRHRNYYEMAVAVTEVEGLVGPEDVLLLSLPLAHSFGRLMHLAGTRVGFTIAFCPDPQRTGEALVQVRPTILPSVPRLFEKMHAATLAAFAAQPRPRRALAGWALRVGRRASRLRQEGRSLPPFLALQHRLADRLVYSKLRERLGGRLRLAVSGGAPLAPEIAEFFHALGLLILEGYGETECTTAVSVNRPDRFRFGTVGLPLPRFEVATAADGELLVRSATVFAGYYRDEEATREVLTGDGWLRTGDVGEIDGDGFIRITDRKKEIIVTAGGKKVAPQALENELKTSRFVSQALVVGDRRPYVAALVTLDADGIRAWAERHGIAGDAGTLATHPGVVALVQEAVDDVNRHRSPFEQIRRFAILTREFSPDAEEVTPTLKLRRRVCEAHFAAEIDALYAEPAPRREGMPAG
ncbi:MAG TPA: long-chain fatty acid--CoA ligase [Gaiellaceae bacterium]|nr:long-chain fatty acid--CoA ligase [Gaiellaceae bacterium]